MSVEVEMDKSALMAQINRDCRKAELVLADQVKADSKKFVPKQEGTLREDVFISQDTEGTVITYEQIYAAYQWYGIRADGTHPVHHYTTPGTGTQWCEKAKEQYINDWLKVAQNALNGG